MGKELGFNYFFCLSVYRKAKKKELVNEEKCFFKQKELLGSNKLKILLAGHPYNLRDKFLCDPLINILKRLDIEIIYGDVYDKKVVKDLYKTISPHLYWTYSEDIVNSLLYYKEIVDGIIMISSFPCGPDSLVNENYG
jgi:predicted nucleotide-binding protein (sugar kinase/HSP70/actin superfamily)